jgi:hypothetical protein
MKISAHAVLKKSIKFITCGSIAEHFIVVSHCLKTFATIRFSVGVTQNEAFRVISQEMVFQLKTKCSVFHSKLYQIFFNQFRCASIGLFQILSHPGVGMEIFQSLFKSGAKSKILTLTFFISSKSNFHSFKFEESIIKVLS